MSQMTGGLELLYKCIAWCKEKGIVDIGLAFSMGKESLTIMDAFTRAGGFKIKPYYMEYGRLQFVEDELSFYEKYFGVPIKRYPHPDYTTALREGIYRPKTDNSEQVPDMTFADLRGLARGELDFVWQASGERVDDSIYRRLQLKPVSRENASSTTFRLYPVMLMTKEEVIEYVRIRQIPLPRISREIGRSFGGLNLHHLQWVKDNHPKDFDMIEGTFPQIRAILIQQSMKTARKNAAEEEKKAEEKARKEAEKKVKPKLPKVKVRKKKELVIGKRKKAEG